MRFVADQYAVPIAKKTIVGLRVRLPQFDDLCAYVDDRGLQPRWRGRRGHLNFKPQAIVGHAEVIDVRLPTRERAKDGAIFGRQNPTDPQDVLNVLGC